jgi:hypothetical protein
MKYDITHLVAVFIAIMLIFLIIWAIYMQIQEHYLQDDPILKEIKTILQPLFEKGDYTGMLEGMNNKNFLNEIGFYKGDKSYTINKEKIFICLKDENGEYYDMNSLIFVVGHEISHVLCKSIGHTEEFHKIFELFLEEATQLGIYNPSIPMIKNYCEY